MDLNEEASPHEDRLTEVLPFLYLARAMPEPEGGERELTFRGRRYQLRYRNPGRETQVEIYRGDDLLGKLFLMSSPGNGRLAGLQKFRVTVPAENLVVSFVLADSTADERDPSGR